MTFENDTLVLDFAVRPLDEPFEPPPVALTLTLTLSRVALQAAVAGAQAALADFARRLERLNAAAGLGIEAPAQLLIWQDGRHD